MSQLISGLGASSGIAIAPARLLVGTNLTVKQQYSDSEDHEMSKLHDSFAISTAEIKRIKQKAQATLSQTAAHVIETEQSLLENAKLRDQLKVIIHEQHVTAEWAVEQLTKQRLALYKEENSNDYLHKRATAMRDVSQRLLSHLLGVALPDPTSITERSIYVGHTVTPTDTAQFDRRFVAGIVTDFGTRTSHFSIMSKSMTIQAVVGTGNATKYIHNGDLLIVDGIHGHVLVNPSEEEIDHYQRMAGKYANELAKLGALSNQQSVSADGRHYEIAANIGDLADVQQAKIDGAEGIGLLRSEFLYMNKPTLPTEEEQFSAYKQVVTAMPDQRVIIRTLDVGGDKPMAGVKLPHEPNPFLGFRAVRVGLAHQKILRPQIRAILRASVYGRVAIMFPFVTTVDEFIELRKIVDSEREQLVDKGVAVADGVEVGMMLEVPAAAVMADQFAKYVDFFSIGSNDLVQYLLAADRDNRLVSYLYQPLHPAVLRLIKRVVDAAHAEGKWVGCCGELAAMRLATPLLMAMGLDEFSMDSNSILPIRSLVKQLSGRKLQRLAHQSLQAQSAKQVVKLIRAAVPQLAVGDQH